MKKSTKLFALTMAMVMVVSVLLAGCGGDTKTLEQYFADNPSEQEALDESMASFEQPGMEANVEIKDNAIIYTFKFEQTMDEDQAEQAKTMFKEYMGSLGSAFEGIAKSIEEQTEIDGITCQVIYQNGDGSDLFNETYEAAK